MNKTKILIADDNAHLRTLMSNCLSAYDNIQVVGLAANGWEALELAEQLRPDLLILDLVMPMVDGIGVLEKLRLRNASPPRVMVLSAMSHENVVREAMCLGAEYYLLKPFEFEVFCKRVQDIIESGGQHSDMYFNSSTAVLPVPAAQPASDQLDERIAKIFLSVGIPAHIKGYKYLQEAVKMVVADKSLIGRIMKDIYPGVAKRYNASAATVERAIRHAIEVAWNRGNIEHINKIFDPHIFTKMYKPTNGEFIAIIAEKLLLERSA